MTMTEEKANALAKSIAAERRHTLLVGPPGSGATMVARRVAHFLQPTDQQLFDIEQVWRVHGKDPPAATHGDRPRGAPLRAPHHTVNTVAMTGQSPYPRTGVPRFGELSLAHGGVLYLDELPEFHNPVVHAVLNAMKDKQIRWNLAATMNVAYPADFLLVAGAHLCPCGYRPTDRCRCEPGCIDSYRKRIAKVEELCEVVDLGEVKA